ncbi:hypothetical protein YC2023_015444 [Brassica napus]
MKETLNPQINKLDDEGNAVYTQDIGDLNIFFSLSEPFCVPATFFPDLLPNSVDFIDFDDSGLVGLKSTRVWSRSYTWINTNNCFAEEAIYGTHYLSLTIHQKKSWRRWFRKRRRLVVKAMVSIGSLVERKEFAKDKDPERDRKYKVIRRDELSYGDTENYTEKKFRRNRNNHGVGDNSDDYIKDGNKE